MKYYYLTFLVSLSLSSCASVSKSPRACDSVAKGEGAGISRMAVYFWGNIFQVGDCAVSERLRIETGNFVKNRSAPIKKQIIEDKAEYRDDMLALYQLFGCSAQNENELIRFSRDNYSTLFENFENISGRQSMLLIRNKLKEDPILKEKCFK